MVTLFIADLIYIDKKDNNNDNNKHSDTNEQ